MLFTHQNKSSLRAIMLTAIFFSSTSYSRVALAQDLRLSEAQSQCEALDGIWDECAARDWGAYCLDDEGEMQTHRDPVIESCVASCLCPDELVFNGEECVNIEALLSPCDEPGDEPGDEPTSLVIEEEGESIWGDGALTADEFNVCAQAGGSAVIGERCEAVCFSINEYALNIVPADCSEVTDHCECPLGQEFIEGECHLIDPAEISICGGGGHALNWSSTCLDPEGIESDGRAIEPICELVCENGAYSIEQCLEELMGHECDSWGSTCDQDNDWGQEAREDDDDNDYDYGWREEDRAPSDSLSLEDQVGCDASGKVAGHHLWSLILLSLLFLKVRRQAHKATTDQ
jgi:hypothetical protein